MTRLICGVDVASQSLEACIGEQGATGSFANNPEGIAALAAFCRGHQVELVAMEATGGYEQQAFAQLSAEGLPVAILNPRAVRQFAQSMGRFEKTDRIDAGMIASYAAVRGSRPVCLAPKNQHHLRALVTRLRQLTEVRTAQLNQQRLVTDRAVQASFKKLLAVVARQIRELEQKIAALIEADPLWRELNQVFRTIKGVADRTVARLMAEMPEIGTLSNKTISKLAGVAPLANDSGKHQGKRAVRGGRATVREILFIVASVVGRYEPDFVAFRQRLAAAGKPPQSCPHRAGAQTAGPPQRQSQTGSSTTCRAAAGGRGMKNGKRKYHPRSRRGCGKAENSFIVFRGAMRRLFHNPTLNHLDKTDSR